MSFFSYHVMIFLAQDQNLNLERSAFEQAPWKKEKDRIAEN